MCISDRSLHSGSFYMFQPHLDRLPLLNAIYHSASALEKVGAQHAQHNRNGPSTFMLAMMRFAVAAADAAVGGAGAIEIW